jgi:hypothetical protein
VSGVAPLLSADVGAVSATSVERRCINTGVAATEKLICADLGFVLFASFI